MTDQPTIDLDFSDPDHMLLLEHYRPLVARGMIFVDEHSSSGLQYIEWSELDMSRGDRCIVGQAIQQGVLLELDDSQYNPEHDRYPTLLGLDTDSDFMGARLHEKFGEHTYQQEGNESDLHYQVLTHLWQNMDLSDAVNEMSMWVRCPEHGADQHVERTYSSPGSDPYSIEVLACGHHVTDLGDGPITVKPRRPFEP